MQSSVLELGQITVNNTLYFGMVTLFFWLVPLASIASIIILEIVVGA